MLVDWSEPVMALEQDWATQCAPCWERAVALAEPWREGDVLAERDWEAAVALLDTRPEPTTPAAANARWRSFVVALWALRNGVMKRRAAQHRALQARSQR